MTVEQLTPPSLDDLARAIAHALQFDPRKQFQVSGEMMAKITAAHLVECLRRAGYAVMKRPAASGHKGPDY